MTNIGFETTLASSKAESCLAFTLFMLDLSLDVTLEQFCEGMRGFIVLKEEAQQFYNKMVKPPVVDFLRYFRNITL